MNVMTRRVLSFAQTTPALTAALRTIAEGTEFEWRDRELEEMLTQLISEGFYRSRPPFHYLLAHGVPPRVAEEVRLDLEMGAQDPPNWAVHVDWEAVRNGLIGEGN
jgi:hypothetical protein